MRILGSIQAKAILCMIAVSTLAVLVVNQTYQAWWGETSRQALQAKAERALGAYEPPHQSLQGARAGLMLISRRFAPTYVGLIDPRRREVIRELGPPLPKVRFQTFLDETPVASLHGVRHWHPQGADPPSLWSTRAVEGPDGEPCLLLVVESSEYQEITARTLSILSWVTVVGALAFSLLFSYIFRQTVSDPVRDLSYAMEQVAAGDLTSKIGTDVDRELVPLARTFNTMVEELQQKRATVEEYQSSLEQKIEEARQELEAKEAELIQAAKLASVGQLAAGVAHEINNPLHYILLTAGLLERDLADEAAKKRLGELVSQTRRCQRIVSDLLEYSRKDVAPDERIDLKKLIEYVMATVKEDDRLGSTAVRVETEPHVPQICGSFDELYRVFDNIVTNSLQAVGETGTITIRIRSTEADAVQVVIEDDGPGMPPEVAERALEPFYTTKEVGQGTGLGLSIAYGIVARHRGQLSLSSEPGRGTTVVVTLPVDRPGDDAASDDTKEAV